jgi:hypothetical protein
VWIIDRDRCGRRRAGLPRENPLVFYPRRVREVLETHAKLAAFYLYLHRIRRRVERDDRPYMDAASVPPAEPAPSFTTNPRLSSAPPNSVALSSVRRN